MKNNKKGFTLVELVIVVAVMAILVAVAIPTVASITGTAEEAVNNSNARTIESMIKLAEAKADGNKLGEKAIQTAIEDAKLGIEKGTFAYNADKGTVVYGAAAVGEFEIKFEKNATSGVVTVTVTEKKKPA